MPQEELGWYLGLIVWEENKHLYWNPRTGERPPSSYGTRVYIEEFSPNEVFPKLNIPLKMVYHSIDEFADEKTFTDFIEKEIIEDGDLLACFDHGELKGDHVQGGHICVVDQIFSKDGKIRLIDPQIDQPKWRLVKIPDLLAAMKFHGKDKMGGLWEFVPTR